MTAERRVSTLAHLRNGYPFASEDFSEDGDLPLVRIRDLGDKPFETFIDSTLVPQRALINDAQVAIGMDGDFNVRLWDRGLAALNQRVCVLDADPDMDARYLAYALPERLQVINDLTYATTVKHLSSQQVLQLKVPDWSPSEQRTIADFLDREATQIDAMIEAQRDLVALLQERRAAVLRSAVTGAKSPCGRKASGQAWIGDLPEHWDVRPLGALFRTIGSGTTPSNEFLLDAEEGEIPWVTTSELRERAITATNQTLSVETLASTPALVMYPAGTLLVAMYGATIGRLGWLETPACTNQACCAFSQPSGVKAEFVYYTLLVAREHLVVLGTGGGQPNLNQHKLRALRLPVPPLGEQQAIVAELGAALGRMDAMIEAANDSITLMQERRAALISAAVTGRIDPYTGREHLTVEEAS